MKPSLFEYVVPDTVEEAVAARARYDDSVVLSGGQSLVPTLNFRLSNPEVVIDLRRIPSLVGVTIDQGWIRVGGMTRQRVLEHDEAVHRANPLIRETLEHVAHPVIRNRGTIGGSVAHADPSAELPCLLVALDGRVVVHGENGRRQIAARDLFEFIMTTSLEPTEILTEVHFPVMGPRTGWCFTEFSRRHGDFAMAGTAVTVTLGTGGEITACRAAACGVSATPVELTAVQDSLTGVVPENAALVAAAQLAADSVTVPEDTAVSVDYRRHLLVGLVERALRQAVARAKHKETPA